MCAYYYNNRYVYQPLILCRFFIYNTIIVVLHHNLSEAIFSDLSHITDNADLLLFIIQGSSGSCVYIPLVGTQQRLCLSSNYLLNWIIALSRCL